MNTVKIVLLPHYSNPNLKVQKGVPTYWSVNTSMQGSPPVDRTRISSLTSNA